MNFYELLEIREDASDEVIKMAYKALLRKYHPDVYKGDPEFAHEMTAKLNEAYEVLSDPDRKMIYDALISSEYTSSSKAEESHQEKSKPQKKERENDDAGFDENSRYYSDPDELGMDWFGFYVNITLALGAIRGGRSIIRSLFFDSEVQSALFAGGKSSIIMIFAIAIDVATVALCGYLLFALRAFTHNSYILNMLLLSLFPALSAMWTMGSKEEVYFIAIAVIFSALNIKYFQKRSFLFDEIDEPCNLKNYMKRFVIMIVISGAIICGFHFVLSSDVNNVSETQPSDTEVTSSEVWDDFDELAELYGFESAREFVVYIAKDMEKNLYDYTAQHKYEYIASEYFGLTPYDEAIGLVDPHSNTTIRNFHDYHKYVYAACKESIENDSE